MKKLAIIALLATQALAFGARAAEVKTVVFCNTQNAIGQQAVVEVTEDSAGRRQIGITLLGVSILREEASVISANQYGASYASKSVSLSAGMKATDAAAYVTGISAKGILTAKIVGADNRKVSCEFPK